MKWRKWPEEKPKDNNMVDFHFLRFHIKSGIGPRYVTAYEPIGSYRYKNNIEWLDESDAAFEELSESRGWGKIGNPTKSSVKLTDVEKICKELGND